MPRIKVNDITLYYETQGEGEPVVLIGGFSVDHTMWFPIVDLLKKNYQVILLDNRGAGQTDVPVGAYSIEQMSTDVAALCMHLGIKQAHFIGSSMGGFIVQMLSYQHADLVKSAVISNSSFHAKCNFNLYLQAQLELLKANAPFISIIKAVNTWIYSFQFLSQPDVLERLIQLQLNNPYPFTITGYEGQHAALQQFDSRKWIIKINTPTLVIGGDQDLVFSEASVKRLAQLIPQANYDAFADCGHLPMVEYPLIFAEKVHKHIQKHSLNQNGR